MSATVSRTVAFVTGNPAAAAASIACRAEVAWGFLEQAVPLMTAQEIMQPADTQVVGFHRNLPPFQLRRMDWRGNAAGFQIVGLQPEPQDA